MGDQEPQRRPDLVLRTVLDVILKDDDAHFTLTVLAGGALVRGRAVTERRWLTEWSRLVDQHTVGDDSLVTFGRSLRSALETWDQDTTRDTTVLRLVDAAVLPLGPAGVEPTHPPGGLWSVQTHQIASWSPGYYR